MPNPHDDVQLTREQVQAISSADGVAEFFITLGYPIDVRQVMTERLDMLPVTKQVGFFSDAYCVECTYAKALLIRKQLALVLSEKITQGQYDRSLALSIARAILYDTPQTLLGMVPRSR